MKEGDKGESKLPFGKFCVIFVFICFVAFTAAVIYESWGRGIPDSLIYSVFAFISAEGGLLAWLKIAERKAPAKKATAKKKVDPVTLLRAALEQLEGEI